MADKSVFDSEKILGDGLFALNRSKLVALAADICVLAFKERSANGYRGGIRPDNISIKDSIVAIGPAEKASKDDCSKAELEYISPEFFWSGKAGSQSDVYSVGLLLYAGICGKLPFVTNGSDDDRAQAFRKRMNGDKVKAPAGIGKKLGSIIEQATAFSAADRYENTLELAEELKALLVKADAEAMSKAAMNAFGKPESELSDVERMMIGIITDAALSDELADVPVEEVEEPEVEEAEEIVSEESDIEVEIEELPPEPEEPEEESIEVEIEELPPEPEEPEEESIEVEIEELPPEPEEPEEEDFVIKFDEVPSAEEAAEEPAKEAEPVAEAPVTEEIKPEEEEKPIEVPAFVNAPAKPASPAPAPAEEKKRPKSYIVIIGLCVILAIAAIIYNSVSDKTDANAKQTLPPITYITPEPTAEPKPEDTAEPVETDEPEATPEPEKVSSYQIFTENVSWDQAEQKCKDLGGHLVCINDEEEYNKICELLSTVSAKYVWIGCYRSSAGILTWTNGDDVDYYNWAYREPSLKDSYDGTAEDYIMLARQSDGTWKYNDSRMDPMADYARFYSGNIAYICEIVE